MLQQVLKSFLPKVISPDLVVHRVAQLQYLPPLFGPLRPFCEVTVGTIVWIKRVDEDEVVGVQCVLHICVAYIIEAMQDIGSVKGAQYRCPVKYFARYVPMSSNVSYDKS